MNPEVPRPSEDPPDEELEDDPPNLDDELDKPLLLEEPPELLLSLLCYASY